MASHSGNHHKNEMYEVLHALPKQRGMDLLKESHINKGMAFSLRERQFLGIHGLLPPAFMSAEEQAARIMLNIRRAPNNLARYVILSELQDRNEKLFYRVLCENVEELMPIVYTPTVGEACRKFGFIYRRPKGVYLTIHDNNVKDLYQILANWPERNVKAIVFTDGERILGLGDLGAQGMGIPVGKLSLYVALAGINPRFCLPVYLDVGTDNQDLLNDPLYIGLRQKRVKGQEYLDFLDNVMHAFVLRYGRNCLIQFEDFANRNAFTLLNRYAKDYCTFNDDIQGTASVVVTGLLAAARVTGKPMHEQRYLLFGAGEAATGIANLLASAIARNAQKSVEEARKHIFMFDIGGLLVTTRTDLNDHQKVFAQEYEHLTALDEVISSVKPGGIIGVAGAPGGMFTPKILKMMAALNERPIIFALSNPTSRAECTAVDAYRYTDAKCIFASGSPFDPVVQGGRTYTPGQGNNAYIFPGVALGIILNGIKHVTDTLFLIASETVANLVTQEHLDEGRIFPPLTTVREISVQIASRIAEHCYRRGTAAHWPEPEDKEKFIRDQLWNYEYENMEPHIYDWEKFHQQKMPTPSFEAYGMLSGEAHEGIHTSQKGGN